MSEDVGVNEEERAEAYLAGLASEREGAQNRLDGALEDKDVKAAQAQLDAIDAEIARVTETKRVTPGDAEQINAQLTAGNRPPVDTGAEPESDTPRPARNPRPRKRR
jgi:hypothetical protein